MAMHNARRGRLPLVLMAGKAPYTVRGELPGSRDNYVHFHPGALRPVGDRAAYVKWEWTLPSGVIDQGDAAARAHGRAQRSHGAGVPDAAARDADANLGRGGDASLFPRSATARCARARADSGAIARLAEKLLARNIR